VLLPPLVITISLFSHRNYEHAALHTMLVNKKSQNSYSLLGVLSLGEELESVTERN